MFRSCLYKLMLERNEERLSSLELIFDQIRFLYLAQRTLEQSYAFIPRFHFGLKSCNFGRIISYRLTTVNPRSHGC